ncbi:MAG: hypothetical protein R3309_00165 [Reinekea sp.]|nr:hypothetical protein [Reinekea sp.]
MNIMYRMLLTTITIAILQGCANNEVNKFDNSVQLAIDPFVFQIEESTAPYIEVFSFTSSLAGANVAIGENNDTGFGLSKVSPDSIFANGPAKLGVKNRKFLERLLDETETSQEVTKLRQAMGITSAKHLTQHLKDDWLFISFLSDVGAMAYGANDNYELVFLINHNEGIEALNQLIEQASFIHE